MLADPKAESGVGADDREGRLREAQGRIGSTLRAKWHLDTLLELGGMGAVYEATHRNGMRGALKILDKRLGQSAAARKRFLRKGLLANEVAHSGSVSVLDDDETEDGCAFLVMELLTGATLEHLAERSGGMLPSTNPNTRVAVTMAPAPRASSLSSAWPSHGNADSRNVAGTCAAARHERDEIPAPSCRGFVVGNPLDVANADASLAGPNLHPGVAPERVLLERTTIHGEDAMGELIDKVKGKIKKAVGKVTGDKKLEREGKVDEAKGKVKGVAEEGKQAVKDAVK